MLIKILPCVKGPLRTSVMELISGVDGCKITNASEGSRFVVGMAGSSWWPNIPPSQMIIFVNGTHTLPQGATYVRSDLTIIAGDDSRKHLRDFLTESVVVQSDV